MRMSCRCGPTPVVPRSRSRAVTASSASSVGASPSYSSRVTGRPSCSAQSAKGAAKSAITSVRVSTSARPSSTTCVVHGSSASRLERPAPIRRSAAFRCATAPAYSIASDTRAGKRRPMIRSKYARRTAGPPFTTASRSGVNTSVAISFRNCSAARREAPFSVARLPCSDRSVNSIATADVSRVPRNAMRPWSSPKRRSCASDRVRGEKP